MQTNYPFTTKIRPIEKIPRIVDLTRLRFQGLIPIAPVSKQPNWLLCNSGTDLYSITRYGVDFRDGYPDLRKYYFILRRHTRRWLA